MPSSLDTFTLKPTHVHVHRKKIKCWEVGWYVLKCDPVAISPSLKDTKAQMSLQAASCSSLCSKDENSHSNVFLCKDMFLTSDANDELTSNGIWSVL